MAAIRHQHVQDFEKRMFENTYHVLLIVDVDHAIFSVFRSLYHALFSLMGRGRGRAQRDRRPHDVLRTRMAWV